MTDDTHLEDLFSTASLLTAEERRLRKALVLVWAELVGHQYGKPLDVPALMDLCEAALDGREEA